MDDQTRQALLVHKALLELLISRLVLLEAILTRNALVNDDDRATLESLRVSRVYGTLQSGPSHDGAPLRSPDSSDGAGPATLQR